MKVFKIISIASLFIFSYLLSQKDEYRFSNPIPKPTSTAIGYDYQNQMYIYNTNNQMPSRPTQNISHSKKKSKKGYCSGDKYHAPHKMPNYKKSKWTKVKPKRFQY